MTSVSMGVSWKSEEREDVDEAAALRRIWGKGDDERKEGRAALRELVDIGDDVIWRITGHVVGKTSGIELRKGWWLLASGGKIQVNPSKFQGRCWPSNLISPTFAQSKIDATFMFDPNYTGSEVIYYVL